MPDNIDTIVEPQLDENGQPLDEDTIDENANADSLRPGGGTAGAGDSRAEKIAGIILNLTKLSGDDLNGFEKSLAQIGKEAEGIGDVAGKNKNSIAAKPSAASVKQVVKEELEQLFGEEEALSEGFVDKATTLFEAAVTSRVELERVELEEEFENQLSEQTETMVKEFSERLDTYLDYVAEQWMTENKIAVESGIRSELTEGFLAGLRDLFNEHYIDVPEGKVDIVEALTEQVSELQEQLNLQINENIALNSANDRAEQGKVLAEATDGLTDADAERLATLAEDLDFDDVDEFREKVNILRENFFGEKAPKAPGSNGLVIEEVGLVEDDTPTGPASSGDEKMDRYLAAIRKDLRK